MANALTIFFVIVRIALYPITLIFNLALYILKPVIILGNFILLPFLHLSRAIIHVLTFPFRLQLLERIETLYIYLGTASLIGCMTGAVLFILFKVISSSLNLDAPKPREQGRTTAEYRAARRERAHASEPETPVVVKRIPTSRKRGLLSQAIVEEAEDSDF
ncbi:hypothetical protein P153DRAFT_292961 [Dothidotthia symphoricarpi CBS 119687]|uniref:Uncharacterized protein n=1 Tax=Dothidotthia symphoricarpi CBS 119687 TaxID=1392245 RepID=A0A6A6A8Q0_9PLEO|nr:uncharacterized protein P153DRAFT_292961 [Dothidotthia symphoricarpi CBS 119687]KAF2128342.1 hypothetical protein P153DRAFT_292961 [Dothidotthia symphoricarpi CBS 119687]